MMGDRDFRTTIKNAVDSIGKELEIDIEPLIKPKPKIIASLNTSLNNKKNKKNDDADDATNDTNTFKSFSGTGNKLGSK